MSERSSDEEHASAPADPGAAGWDRLGRQQPDAMGGHWPRRPAGWAGLVGEDPLSGCGSARVRRLIVGLSMVASLPERPHQ